MPKKVFSGIQPTGNLHIGNYLGAIKNWVKSQDEFDNIFCVVDLHAITIWQDPNTLPEKIKQTAGLLLACGIDPQKSVLFVQSHIKAHSELAWILNCFTPMGWLERMTQFKEKSLKNKERASAGLFDYPVLMAADILLYETDLVPVGQDQKQHVELARDIAKRFNSLYDDTLKIPQALVSKQGARIMALDRPNQKMSKSSEQPNGVIDLLDQPDIISKKIQIATTDSEKDIVFDEKRAGIYNLLTIYQGFSGQSKEEIEDKFKNSSYADFKKDLAEVIITGLQPIQQKYQDLTQDPKYIENILAEGASKIRPIAEKTLARVKQKVGLI